MKGEFPLVFNEIMALIFPSIIGILLYVKFTNKTLSILEALGITVLFNLVTNCICYAILYFFKGRQDFLFTPLFTIKYCLTAVVVVIVIVIAYRFIELNFKVKLKVENTEND